MANKTNIFSTFSDRYLELSEGKQTIFSRVIGKLLNATFILRDLEDDRDDYYFAIEHKPLITAYLALIDYEFLSDDYNHFVYLKTTENRNRLRLNKLDTAVILVLRKIYHVKRREIMSEDKVSVTFDEIIDEIRTSQVFSKDPTNNAYEGALRKFRMHKIIDYPGSKLDINTAIIILPSIQVVIPQDGIEEIIKRINLLNKDYEDDGGEENEIINED